MLCIPSPPRCASLISSTPLLLFSPLPLPSPLLFLQSSTLPFLLLLPLPLLPLFPRSLLPIQTFRFSPRSFFILLTDYPCFTQYLLSKSGILSPSNRFFVRSAYDGCGSTSQNQFLPPPRGPVDLHIRSSSICLTSLNDPTPPLTLTTVPISTPLRSTSRPVAVTPFVKVSCPLRPVGTTVSDVGFASRVVGVGAGSPQVISIVAPLLSSSSAIQRVG